MSWKGDLDTNDILIDLLRMLGESIMAELSMLDDKCCEVISDNTWSCTAHRNGSRLNSIKYVEMHTQKQREEINNWRFIYSH